jgi:hypothetical protein
VVRGLPNAAEIIEAVTKRETEEVERREQKYRDGRPAPEICGRTVILIDDGLATGATMRAPTKLCARAHRNFFRQSASTTRISHRPATKKYASYSRALLRLRKIANLRASPSLAFPLVKQRTERFCVACRGVASIAAGVLPFVSDAVAAPV